MVIEESTSYNLNHNLNQKASFVSYLVELNGYEYTKKESQPKL